MTGRPVPGLGEMTGVVQSHQRERGKPLILRLSPDTWRVAYGTGVLGRGPDMWSNPAGSGEFRRVTVAVGPHMAPGAWQLLADGEVIASGDVEVPHD